MNITQSCSNEYIILQPARLSHTIHKSNTFSSSRHSFSSLFNGFKQRKFGALPQCGRFSFRYSRKLMRMDSIKRNYKMKIKKSIWARTAWIHYYFPFHSISIILKMVLAFSIWWHCGAFNGLHLTYIYFLPLMRDVRRHLHIFHEKSRCYWPQPIIRRKAYEYNFAWLFFSFGRATRTKWNGERTIQWFMPVDGAISEPWRWHDTPLFFINTILEFEWIGCNPVWWLNYGKNARHFSETNYHLFSLFEFRCD